LQAGPTARLRPVCRPSYNQDSILETKELQRGRAPELVAGFNNLDQWFEQAGCTNRRIYVDYDGPMDTVVYQLELTSLDQYFSDERALFVAFHLVLGDVPLLGGYIGQCLIQLDSLLSAGLT